MAKKFEIRISTAEFLIFQIEGEESGVQMVYNDETVWCFLQSGYHYQHLVSKP